MKNKIRLVNQYEAFEATVDSKWYSGICTWSTEDFDPSRFSKTFPVVIDGSLISRPWPLSWLPLSKDIKKNVAIQICKTLEQQKKRKHGDFIAIYNKEDLYGHSTLSSAIED